MRLLHNLFVPGSAFCLVIALFFLCLPSISLADDIPEPLRLKQSSEPVPWPRQWEIIPEKRKVPTIRDLKSSLDHTDHLAALKALQLALDEVGDGSTFVWRRKSNKLKGAIKPTSVFRDDNGRICRHLIFALSLGGYVKSIESVACRGTDGRWNIDG